MTKESKITGETVANIAYIQRDIADIKSDIKDLKGEFITREEFEPVKKIAYGIITAFALGAMGTIAKLIFVK